MANLKRWIEKMADGEPVIGVVIGEMGWGNYGSEQVPGYESMPKGVLLSWETASPMLDYEFDSGYGAPKCNAIYARTESWVIAIVQYDGSTAPYRIPRNPMDIMPRMEGG